MFLAEPTPTPYDVSFRLFGIPVRIHPFFWVIALLLGYGSLTGPWDAMLWVMAVLISILVHELGHASVRRLQGYAPRITLYGFGGLTSHRPNQFGTRPSALSEILAIAAGPAAGLSLAAGAFAVYYFGIHPSLDTSLGLYFRGFVLSMLAINVFWSIMNLIPVIPLDGGQIAREALVKAFPRRGLEFALMLSVIAALVTVLSVYQIFVVYFRGHPPYFLMFLFGYMGFQNFMYLQSLNSGQRY